MRRALVVTVVHHPEDARIRHRQIASLLAAGWSVTFAAPFAGYGVLPTPAPNLRHRDLVRAKGRKRFDAVRSARTLLRREGAEHDLLLLHDPELLIAVAGIPLRTVVWDVHEDIAASLGLKPWLPAVLRRPAALVLRRVERGAERRVHLLLAEETYADRFRGSHPHVPNTTWVPATVSPPDDPRVVYVGHLSRARGVDELIEVAGILHDATAGRLRLQLVGPADAEARSLLMSRPIGIEWLGFLPYEKAMGVLDGALAGLSLLHDEPNYRGSRPTKVMEYLAHGVPAITSALPEATRLVHQARAGLVVPFVGGRSDTLSVARAVLSLDLDRERRHELGRRGHAYALAHLDWAKHGDRFVAELDQLASAP